MTEACFAAVEGRGVIEIGGEDRVSFLQGLISNDVAKAAAGRAVYAALLTPQGRYLHDFFVVEKDGVLLLECEAPRAADLKRRLSLYKLRSKVAVAEVSQAWHTYVAWRDGVASRFSLTDE